MFEGQIRYAKLLQRWEVPHNYGSVKKQLDARGNDKRRSTFIVELQLSSKLIVDGGLYLLLREYLVLLFVIYVAGTITGYWTHYR